MESAWTQGRLNRSDSVSEGIDKLCKGLGRFGPVRALYGPLCVGESAIQGTSERDCTMFRQCSGDVWVHTRGKLTG